jgi:hypothetical protein
MKRTILTIAMSALAAAAYAGPMGTPTTTSYAAPEPASLFGPGWVASPYALFLTPDADQVDDVWGGGLDIKYFFNTYWSLGIQGQ